MSSAIMPTYDFSVLRELRRKRNWTLSKLAEASGLSYPTVASIEENKASPRLETLDAIAGALGMPTSKLLALANRIKARKLTTKPIDTETLSDLGINIKEVIAANYDELKIFHASMESACVVNPTKLHDGRRCLVLCYCLNGHVVIRVENEEFPLKTNDVIVFDGTLNHEYRANRDSECLVIHIPTGSCRLESLLESTAL